MIETTVVTYKILLEKYTNYKYQLDYVIDGDGTSYDHVSWISETKQKPSKEELDEQIKIHQKTEMDAYIVFKRKQEYPKIEEWIEALIQKEVDGQSEQWNTLVNRKIFY